MLKSETRIVIHTASGLCASIYVKRQHAQEVYEPYLRSVLVFEPRRISVCSSLASSAVSATTAASASSTLHPRFSLQVCDKILAAVRAARVVHAAISTKLMAAQAGSPAASATIAALARTKTHRDLLDRDAVRDNACVRVHVALTDRGSPSFW